MYVNFVQNWPTSYKPKTGTCYGSREKYSKVNRGRFRVNILIDVRRRKGIQRCSACTHEQLSCTENKQIEPAAWLVFRDTGVAGWTSIADDAFFGSSRTDCAVCKTRLVWTDQDVRKEKNKTASCWEKIKHIERLLTVTTKQYYNILGSQIPILWAPDNCRYFLTLFSGPVYGLSLLLSRLVSKLSISPGSPRSPVFLSLQKP